MLFYTVLFIHTVMDIYIYMSALAHTLKPQEQHHWMLWVAPTRRQTQEIKALPESKRERVLMLHPRNMDSLGRALETAISSDLYQAITLPKSLLGQSQQRSLELMAIRNNTALTWVGNTPYLTQAHQLTLI